jgi:hypothetical protein
MAMVGVLLVEKRINNPGMKWFDSRGLSGLPNQEGGGLTASATAPVMRVAGAKTLCAAEGLPEKYGLI